MSQVVISSGVWAVGSVVPEPNYVEEISRCRLLSLLITLVLRSVTTNLGGYPGPVEDDGPHARVLHIRPTLRCFMLIACSRSANLRTNRAAVLFGLFLMLGVRVAPPAQKSSVEVAVNWNTPGGVEFDDATPWSC